MVYQGGHGALWRKTTTKVPGPLVVAEPEGWPGPRRKASQHSTLFAKTEIFIECCDGLEVPTTAKAPVPIVVVLENVLCRGFGLAALADRVDHDVQQQQHNGYDHDEHGKLALAPVAAGQ